MREFVDSLAGMPRRAGASDVAELRPLEVLSGGWILANLTGQSSAFCKGRCRACDSGSDRAIPWSLVGEKPTLEGLASHRVARPWVVSSNAHC